MTAKNIPVCQNDGGRPEGSKERADCTVRAIAIAAGMAYQEAHDLLEAGGRRHGRRFHFGRWLAMQEKIGAYKWSVVYHRIGAKSVGSLCKKQPEGRYIVSVRSHVFAFVDGAIQDTNPVRPGTRIKNVFKLEKENENDEP